MFLYQGFPQGEVMLCFYIRGSIRENLGYVSISKVPSGRSYVMFLYQEFPQGEPRICFYIRGSIRENLCYVAI
jgi:hypothetical protein